MAENMQRVGEPPTAATEGDIESRRAAGRIIADVEQERKMEDKEKHAAYAREYVVKVDGGTPEDLRQHPRADGHGSHPIGQHGGELKLLFFEVQGDHCPCLAEFASSDAKSKAAESARVPFGRIPQEQISERIEEQIVEVPVPQITDEVAEVARPIQQERVQQRMKRLRICPFRRQMHRPAMWSRSFLESESRNASGNRL